MSLKGAFVAAICFALHGCSDTYPQWEVDQQKRIVLFRECLAALPAGPVSAHYNDWSEVVEECGSQARVQSLYCVQNCPLTPRQAEAKLRLSEDQK